MYFPIGWPKCLRTDENDAKLLYVASNLERVLFAILTEDSICLWYCKVGGIVLTISMRNASLFSVCNCMYIYCHMDATLVH